MEGEWGGRLWVGLDGGMCSLVEQEVEILAVCHRSGYGDGGRRVVVTDTVKARTSMDLEPVGEVCSAN